MNSGRHAYILTWIFRLMLCLWWSAQVLEGVSYYELKIGYSTVKIGIKCSRFSIFLLTLIYPVILISVFYFLRPLARLNFC